MHGIHLFGRLVVDLAPVVRAVLEIPSGAWRYRSDPESLTTCTVGEGSDHFPYREVSTLLDAARERHLGAGYANRVLLSNVPAGCRILTHTDDFGEAVRSKSIHCHIPLITDERAVMQLPDGDVHMMAGHLYRLDETVRHAVENPSATDRIHLLFAHFPH